MKCGTWVVWRDARKRGSGTPYRKPIRWYHSGFDRARIPMEDAADAVICDGTVTASIHAADEPDWGGHYATLEITYKCDTCEGQIYPHLPQDEASLSKFVTDAIAKA